MSWRQSNWDNPYAKKEEYPMGMYAIDKAMSECFEAGADAMLEALYQEGNNKWFRFDKKDGEIVILREG